MSHGVRLWGGAEAKAFACLQDDDGRVHLTGGNRSGLTGYRSYRSGPVPVWAGTKPVQIQNSNLNSKKIKEILKILQVATNLMVSNFLKNSFV